MPDNFEGRLSSLEADNRHRDDQWEDIKAFMIRQSITLSDIKSSLAVITGNQDDMKDYQKRCDAERSDMRERMNDVEGFQNRILKTASALSVGFATMISILAEYFKH